MGSQTAMLGILNAQTVFQGALGNHLSLSNPRVSRWRLGTVAIRGFRGNSQIWARFPPGVF